MARQIIVREKEPNADFGVYFEITNALGSDLVLVAFQSNNGECTQCLADHGTKIPSDGNQHEIHLNDPCSSQGADGIVYFDANVDGGVRHYIWSGACPVWSSNNSASGPGIRAFNGTGHPLTVTIFVDKSTPGWKPG